MRLAYWRSDHGNFGDDMNVWFWDRVLPGWKDWRSDDSFLFGIGTILNDTSLGRDGYPVVVGSGTGYNTVRPVAEYPRADFRFVRGPLTAERLGLPADRAISDPAILTPQVLEPAEGGHGNVLFVPHHATAALGVPWARWCEALDVELLSPSGESEQVIRRIAGARLVIAESMHAAIIADAYRVPWVAVELSGGFNRFKWTDWASSLDMRFTSLGHAARVARLFKSLRRHKELPAVRSSESGGGLPSPNEAKEARRSAVRFLRGPLGLAFKLVLRQALRQRPSLSDDAVLRRRQQEMLAALNRTADAYAA